MGQLKKVLELIDELKHEIVTMDQDRAELVTQNAELLSALSRFTACLTIECKNKKRRKDDAI